MTWVLVLFMFGYGPGGGMTTVNVPGFSSEQQCKDAAVASFRLTADTTGSAMRAVCLKKGE